MTDFSKLSEQEAKNKVQQLIDKIDTMGIVAFVNDVVGIISNTSTSEDQQKSLINVVTYFSEQGPAALSNPDCKDPSELVQFLINGCEAMIKSCTDAARVNARAKVPLYTCRIRAHECLSFAYEACERFQDAARTLAEIPLDQGLPSFEDDYKFSLYVMLAELQLKCGNEVSAENYLNNARPLEREAKIQQGARDRFNLCYARVLDSSRKFVEAANRYFLVSSGVEESDALEALRRATVCATLAEPSAARNRVLGALYRDEKRSKLGDVGSVIEKLFHQRVLRQLDIDSLKPLLLTQHQAVGTDKKTTVFDLAITRHNIVSASKIYSSITFEDLGALLGTNSEQAETLVSQMAAQGRISATIDQLEGYVSFVGNAAVPILRWDNQIDTVGNLIATVAETIVKKHPEFEPKGGL